MDPSEDSGEGIRPEPVQELEKARSAERKARGDIEILRQALEAFTSRRDVDEIVSHLEGFLMRLVPHDCSAVCFFEGEGLRPHSIKGDSRKGTVAGAVINHPVFQREIREAIRPVLLPEPGSGLRVGDPNAPVESGKFMVVPMRAGTRNIGCVTLECRERERFDETGALLAQALANEAAIALECARLTGEVEKLTTVDALTGLHTRRQFNAASLIEFRRSLRFRLKLSVIMMDIDHLMRVNDGHGRIAGDTVLAGAADVCLRGIRVTDLHARYGGEEFCFLLPETDQKGAHVLAERLRASVAGLRFRTDKRNFSVTASFGIAERQSDTDSIERLLERSDQALFKAKCEGRNRVVLWTERVGKFWKPG
jgi:diguanylate cyclase (GGDEF)-like protein